MIMTKEESKRDTGFVSSVTAYPNGNRREYNVCKNVLARGQ